MAERVERFRGAGIDRLIVSPVHVERDQQLHTLNASRRWRASTHRPDRLS